MVKTFTNLTVIDKNFNVDRLVIESGAVLSAPIGKFLTLTVNGIGKPLVPGTYVGEIVVSVSDLHHQPAHGLHTMGGRTEELHSAIVIKDNELVSSQCTPTIIQGGKYDCETAQGIYIATSEDDFTGIVVTGDSKYHVKNSKFDFDGVGTNDFMGVGAGIVAMDNTKLTIDSCEFTFTGRTRCAVHVAGDSIVEVNNCRFINLSHDMDDFMGDFSWGCAFRGSNRLVQLCDDATAYYNNCDFITNGWGIFSIDGCMDCVRYYIKDSLLSLSGPDTFGYGIFCIGDRNITSFDNCKVNVNGYPVMVRGFIDGMCYCEVVNGSELSGMHYGIVWLGDKSTPVYLADSSIITGKSSFLLKSSAAKVNVERCVIKPANGVICQLMANDEVTQMMVCTSPVVADREDAYIEGRDLYSINPKQDCVFTFSNMNLIGNFYNSTHNLHLELGGQAGASASIPFHGMFDHMKPDFDLSEAPPEVLFPDLEDRGPKNLEINLKKAYLEGVASSATEKHRDDLEYIDESTRLELSNVVQTPAPTVNNGVIVNLDSFSTWMVTDTSYISALSYEKGSIIKAFGGKKVVLTVDEKEIELGDVCESAEEFKGRIVLTTRDWLPGEKALKMPS